MRRFITLLFVLCLFITLVQAQHTTITSDTLSRLDLLNTISFEEGIGGVLGDLAFNYTDDLLATRIETAPNIQIWQSATGLLAGELTSTTAFTDTEMGNQHNWLVSLDLDDRVVIWDLVTMMPIKEFRNQQNDLTFDLKISADDAKVLVSGNLKSGEYEITVWNVILQKNNKISVPMLNRVTDFAISPDGKTLAVVDETNEITIWDTENYNLLSSMQLNQEIFHVTYSVDNKKIIASYLYTSGIIWDLTTDKVETLPDLHYDDFVSSGYISLIPLMLDKKTYAVDISTGDRISLIPFLQPGEFDSDHPLGFNPDKTILINRSTFNGIDMILFGLNTDFAWVKQDVYKAAFSPNSYYFAIYNLFERKVSITGIK